MLSLILEPRLGGKIGGWMRHNNDCGNIRNRACSCDKVDMPGSKVASKPLADALGIARHHCPSQGLVERFEGILA